MITRIDATRQTDWQQALAQAVRDPDELLRRVGLDRRALPELRERSTSFPLRVPASYIERMRPGDPHDPLLRQVLPLGLEDRPSPGFGEDPVGDLASMAVPGLLHKYHGRALLVVTGACAVHCRYCFRRHYPYAEASATPSKWEPALAYLRADATITEVILSGGDPLSIPDRRLAPLGEALAEIPHLERLRIHTRLPIVLPERITGELTEWLGKTRLRPVVVVHANHARELDEAVLRGLARLRGTGAHLLNQAVLLRGINDSVGELIALSERLFQGGVLPYYLHQLDPVDGAGHFEVGDPEAVALANTLAKRLPGYLVPRLVRERPGEAAKGPVVGPD